MKYIALIFSIAAMLILSGCAMTTSEASLVSKNRIATYCSDQDFEDLVKKLDKRMSDCFGMDTQLHLNVGTSTTDNRVAKRVESDGSVIYIHSTKPALNPAYFTLRVKLEKGSDASCASKITTHTMNGFWDKTSNKLGEWLKTEEASCY